MAAIRDAMAMGTDSSYGVSSHFGRSTCLLFLASSALQLVPILLYRSQKVYFAATESFMSNSPTDPVSGSLQPTVFPAILREGLSPLDFPI